MAPVTHRRMVSYRTLEDDWVRVDVDVTWLARVDGPEELITREDKEEEFDSREVLDDLVAQEVIDPRNRMIFNLYRQGISKGELARIFDMPYTTLDSYIRFMVQLFRAVWQLDCMRQENEDIEVFEESLNDEEKRVWKLYKQGYYMTVMSIITGRTRTGNGAADGKGRTVMALVNRIKNKARESGLHEYLEAVEEVRKWRKKGL